MRQAVGLVPAAPLFVAGISPKRLDGVDDIAAAADAVVRSVSSADVVVLLAGAERAAVATRTCSDLAGLGRADLAAQWSTPPDLMAAVAHATRLPTCRAPLPLDLAVLCLRMPPGVPLLPIAVPAAAGAAELTELAHAVADALAASTLDTAVLAASDGSAGLSERAPLHVVDGAGAWQDAYVGALRGGDLAGLGRLGPMAARRVGSRGWAPAMTAASLARRIGLAVELTRHAAPRGVGYIVGSAAAPVGADA